MRFFLFTLIFYSISLLESIAQKEAFNYDESKVPVFELPALLTATNGEKISSTDMWENIRRPELLALFEKEMFGKVPAGKVAVGFQVIKEIPDALDGKAILKEVVVTLSNERGFRAMNILIFLPAHASTLKPVPLFVGLNFFGNHTIHASPFISRGNHWASYNKAIGVSRHHSSEAKRGIRGYRWPVEEILARGYGLATIHYSDIDPDFDDGFQNGIHPLFYNQEESQPSEEEWGSIAAWSWGLSRAMDYFVTDPKIDNSKIAVMGHSRLGKTALWAGATDPRFALVVSNNSGCGGAALSKRRFGETIQRINNHFPHWFNDNFTKYDNNEEALPFDQHMLLALVAPRPIYVASAEGDEWADPKGEFLSAYHASEVYELYGLSGLEKMEMPAINKPINNGSVGYHIRSGKHDVQLFDWQAFLNFADQHFH